MMTSNDTEPQRYLDFALALAQRAGKTILPHFRQPIVVADKSGGVGYDPVTEADRGAESVIRDGIVRSYPADSVLGEEHGYAAGTSAYTWVIDPIDGTRSFILGQMHWATLIAVRDAQR
ncbi:MAG: inositol monophosphatase family protein, partial [Casimicrobiaceae bacterium]